MNFDLSGYLFNKEDCIVNDLPMRLYPILYYNLIKSVLPRLIEFFLGI
jgi:hypothetical protein